MFIGHYALGLGSKKFNAAPSLAMMFIAVQLLDLLWPIFTLLGIESFTIDPGNTALTPLNFTSYPWSHSLLMSIVWGIVLGGIYYLFTKNRPGSLLLALLVISHWLLDFITHRPDLQLSPFSETRVGLGLWNHPVLEPVIEFGMFFAGAIIYWNAAKPKRRVGYWMLIGFFVLFHIANLMGPPPPSVEAVSWSANLLWIFVGWAWWVERD
ncbi:MAG TPA: metal-dependent hydrolase [Cyclobacteriaceae bacterium]|nr:metal-dependent hydrolase [Cyclobacteriaceae bacterium]